MYAVVIIYVFTQFFKPTKNIIQIAKLVCGRCSVNQIIQFWKCKIKMFYRPFTLSTLTYWSFVFIFLYVFFIRLESCMRSVGIIIPLI